jgi:hypothetical protein
MTHSAYSDRLPQPAVRTLAVQRGLALKAVRAWQAARTKPPAERSHCCTEGTPARTNRSTPGGKVVHSVKRDRKRGLSWPTAQNRSYGEEHVKAIPEADERTSPC